MWKHVSFFFYGCVVFYCLDLPHSIYPFNSWWASELLPLWGLLGVKLLWTSMICVHKLLYCLGLFTWKGNHGVTCQFFVQSFEEPPNYILVGLHCFLLLSARNKYLHVSTDTCYCLVCILAILEVTHRAFRAYVVLL